MREPLVGIVMGSASDLPTLSPGIELLKDWGVPHEVEIVSAHRTPDRLAEYGRTAAARGLQVVVAAAGGAAHLPGMMASFTVLPVIGVPVPTPHLGGEDSLLSIVQMPGGVPVATVGIGQGLNAALLAVQILAVADPALRTRLENYKAELRAKVADMNAELKGPGTI